jgi:hypothetical protein
MSDADVAWFDYFFVLVEHVTDKPRVFGDVDVAIISQHPGRGLSSVLDSK